MSTANTEKQQLIKEMLAMQKKFIAKEQAGGIEAEEYFSPEEGDDLEGYQAKYNELANQLVEMAHAEKGSNR
ncbi:MAG: hypothetical protein KTR32_21435 [Granulosicoccus sp.]|nr:hypothetical protein [Granulosicoccus sp.]